MKPYVRYVNGRFILTLNPPNGEVLNRPLTFWERVLWRLFARTPNW